MHSPKENNLYQNDSQSEFSSPTNSTGKTEHFFAIVTFSSGANITAFGVMC